MDLHNTVEDIVISRVDEIFDALEEKNDEKFCICNQCRMDIICYALNRLRPHYIQSHRGASRVKTDSLDYQQQKADIAAVIYDGFKRVNHNQRPNFSHSGEHDDLNPNSKYPVFNVPTIMGRLFNGDNFAPLHEATLELLWKGERVSMKDGNWQNPSHLVQHTEGTYSFWPAPALASRPNNHKIFEFTLRVSSPGFDTMTHFFKIPVVSETREAGSFNLERTFKLPDLYMFAPGEAEKNGYL